MAVTLVMAGITCLIAAGYGPLWLAVTTVAAFGVAIWRDWQRDTGWQLRWVPGVEGGWQARSSDSDEWRGVAVRCDYLGPWLIGLHVAGKRRWLWPDSAPFKARRVLRRALLWSSSAQRRA